MADYNSLQAAVDAGETNMTVVLNHEHKDDEFIEVSTGIDWFKFNDQIIDKIYVCSNSAIDFDNGVNSSAYSDHEYGILVNLRDNSLWDVLKETGEIDGVKFFKIRWKGVSNWNESYETQVRYQLYYDLFLIEGEIIYLNYYNVPTSNFTNDNKCNSLFFRPNVLPGGYWCSFSSLVSAGIPCECYWNSTNGDGSVDETGCSWGGAYEGKPDLTPPTPPTPPGPEPEPAPEPTIPFDFPAGHYRAKVRVTFKNELNVTDHVESEPFEFDSNYQETFATISDARLMEIVNKYYNNEIDELPWNIGDVRDGRLLSSQSYAVSGMYISEQTVQWRIIGFDHDDLVTPINGHTKAAITLEMVGSTVDTFYHNYPTKVTWGYTGLSWPNSVVRTLLQNYVTFLPNFVPKQVYKLTNYGRRRYYATENLKTTQDYVFLLSVTEMANIPGDSFNNNEYEGEQYQFYIDAGVSPTSGDLPVLTKSPNEKVVLRTPYTDLANSWNLLWPHHDYPESNPVGYSITSPYEQSSSDPLDTAAISLAFCL